MKKSTVRITESVQFEEDGDMLKIRYTGNGFLYNMVRIIVGTLVEVGLGTREISSIDAAFDTLDRQQTGQTAPACGLTLWEVKY